MIAAGLAVLFLATAGAVVLDEERGLTAGLEVDRRLAYGLAFLVASLARLNG